TEILSHLAFLDIAYLLTEAVYFQFAGTANLLVSFIYSFLGGAILGFVFGNYFEDLLRLSWKDCLPQAQAEKISALANLIRRNAPNPSKVDPDMRALMEQYDLLHQKLVVLAKKSHTTQE